MAADDELDYTDDPVYLTTAEVAARFRTAPSSVNEWRQKGTGPLGVRFGRNVLYPLDEVEAWERQQVEAARALQRRRAGLHEASAPRTPRRRGQPPRRAGSSAAVDELRRHG